MNTSIIGWRGNSFSLILSIPEYRAEIPSGEFGHHAPYFCENCGPTTEPETICTYRGCGFESFSGPEPAEYEWRCNDCGSLETVYEQEGDGGPFRATRRYRIPGLGVVK